MKTVFLVVGVPGSGKTWVCKQLAHKFAYVPHDDHDEREYPEVLFAETSETKPVLGEIPFGLSKIHAELVAKGAHVVPVFILEDESTLKRRYQTREGKPILAGHLSRQKTYRVRASELGAFTGTAAEVLSFLGEQA